MSDVFSVFTWWLAISVLGWVFLPITFSLLGSFRDKGWIFTKIIGILIPSYTIWLLGSLHIVPFTRITLILLVLGWILFNFWLFKKPSFLESLKNTPKKLIMLEELLFFLALAFWSFVRAHEPSIHGLEKFMDFGFVNSILRSTSFPPADMWLTKSPDYPGGYFINYYYFGHYILAFLTKLSGIDSAVTYNLMMATLFAFTFALPFSLGFNLSYIAATFQSTLSKGKQKLAETLLPIRFRFILMGLLTAFLVALGGNLHTLYVLTSGYPNESPEPFWKLSLAYEPNKYWYPNATRFIPFTIHEFPIYSFVVADLHGHVSDIPMVLLILALLAILATKKQEEKDEKTKPSSDSRQFSIAKFLSDFHDHTGIPLLTLFIIGLLLAIMYMTNAWDGFIYMVVTGMIILLKNLKNIGRQPSWTPLHMLYKTFSSCLFLFFFFLLASLPFSLNFKPFASGIGVLCAPKVLIGKSLGPLLFEEGKCQKSPLWMMAVLWGFFYYNVFAFLIFTVKKFLKQPIPLDNMKNPFWKRLFYKLYSLDIFPSDGYILVLLLVSSLLLIFPEYFYLKDIYPAHYRANTMFKLGYQAFMMLGIASPYIAFRLRIHVKNALRNPPYLLYTAGFIILFAFVAIYPLFAVNSYYGGLQTNHGLNGLTWISDQYPEDAQAILWLRKTIQCTDVTGAECTNQPVILEANGDSYTDYARVSANTGLPTVIGWPVHEWLWRGSYDEAGRRIPEVATVYESADLEVIKEIIKKYRIEYIFLGTLERQKYKNISEEKLGRLGKVVFEAGETKIYKVNSSL